VRRGADSSSSDDSKRRLSDDHKAALVAGRAEARIVREYLLALAARKPRPGRKRTVDSARRQLAAVEAELETPDLEIADPLRKLDLLQAQIDLAAEVARLESMTDMSELEQKFVSVASAYARRKGITFDVWREMGVPASVLTAAGISASPP